MPAIPDLTNVAYTALNPSSELVVHDATRAAGDKDVNLLLSELMQSDLTALTSELTAGSGDLFVFWDFSAGGLKVIDATNLPTGVTDHGGLTGLADDDHSQYHNDARALTWLGTRTADDLPTGVTNLYLTGAERTKLAGVEAGATADQSAAEILASLLTVDGAGSLLDADLLDGLQATAFATAAQGALAATAIQPGDIDTLAELNAIIADATLIDTNDSRLSDARTPTAHAATHVNGADDIQLATSLQKGLMSSTYATKLDGIEAGATADQSASEILTALLGVDGTGSLLDADLLDGLEATAFATAAQGALADSALQNVSEDTTPQAGGNFDLAGFDLFDSTGVVDINDDVVVRNTLTVQSNVSITGALNATRSASPVSTLTRTSSDTNLANQALRLVHNSSADMVDGFGVGVLFSIDDSADVTNDIASVIARRSGADSTGKLEFYAALAGALTKVATFNSDGTATDFTITESMISDLQSYLASTDIGVSVQAYDPDTTKNDVANTFTQNQTIETSNNTMSLNGTGAGNQIVFQLLSKASGQPYNNDRFGFFFRPHNGDIVQSIYDASVPAFREYANINYVAGTFTVQSFYSPRFAGNTKIGASSAPSYTLDVNGDARATTRLITGGFTVATLPTVVAGGIIYVSDESGGATLAFSDGTNWRRTTDLAIVS